jgi:hypothetical protein
MGGWVARAARGVARFVSVLALGFFGPQGAQHQFGGTCALCADGTQPL